MNTVISSSSNDDPNSRPDRDCEVNMSIGIADSDDAAVVWRDDGTVVSMFLLLLLIFGLMWTTIMITFLVWSLNTNGALDSKSSLWKDILTSVPVAGYLGIIFGIVLAIPAFAASFCVESRRLAQRSGVNELLRTSTEGWRTEKFIDPFMIRAVLILFGLETCAVYLVPRSYTMVFPTMWTAYHQPHPYEGCNTRISPQQASLFTPDTYLPQFPDPAQWRVDITQHNTTAFLAIQNDETMCSVGFVGNSDLYGLGIRIGIYTQWFASLCANQLFSGNGKELQKVYPIFSIAICVTTLVSTLRNTCIFSIEIEILHWMFWGGSVSVFASAPSTALLGSPDTLIGLSGTYGIQLLTYLIMFYHGLWFMWYGYDQTFTKMPCGTYQFFLIRVLDPSRSFWSIRTNLTVFISPYLYWIALCLPAVAIIFVVEVVRASKHVHTFQTSQLMAEQLRPPGTEPNQKISFSYLRVLLRIVHPVIATHRNLLRRLDLPAQTSRSVRLITPLDLSNRKVYRICCAILGTTSWALSIAAIELTLKWNKIIGVNSLASTGQYMPLTIGIASLISVLWKLLRQEAERRRNLTSNRHSSEELAGTELLSLNLNSGSFMTAVNHALQQADNQFLTDGGMFPDDAEDVTENLEPTTSTRPVTSTLNLSLTSSSPPTDTHIMSGAIGPDAV